MKRYEKGMTLLELATAIVIFSLFTLILFYCLIFGVKYSRRIESKSDLSLSTSRIMEKIAMEYRQCLPCRMVQKVLPAVSESELSLPNASKPVSDAIVYTIPHFSYFPGNGTALVFDSPKSLETIHLCVDNGNCLMRERIVYDDSGLIQQKERRAILLLSGKNLAIEAHYIHQQGIRITLSARDNLNRVSFSQAMFSESR